MEDKPGNNRVTSKVLVDDDLGQSR